MKVLGIHRIIPVFPVQTSTPARSFSLTVVFCMSFDCSWQHIKEPPTHPDEGAPPVPATKRSDFTQSANLLPSVFADWEAQTSPGSAVLRSCSSSRPFRKRAVCSEVLEWECCRAFISHKVKHLTVRLPVCGVLLFFHVSWGALADLPSYSNAPTHII